MFTNLKVACFEVWNLFVYVGGDFEFLECSVDVFGVLHDEVDCVEDAHGRHFERVALLHLLIVFKLRQTLVHRLVFRMLLQEPKHSKQWNVTLRVHAVTS